MHKKFMMACMAIAAIVAFVIAPAASASPVLTSNGVKVPVGTSITAVNIGITKFTAGGITVECDHDHLVGTVTENTGTKIKVKSQQEAPNSMARGRAQTAHLVSEQPR
jgi:hypothetical protein